MMTISLVIQRVSLLICIVSKDDLSKVVVMMMAAAVVVENRLSLNKLVLVVVGQVRPTDYYYCSAVVHQ